MSILINCSQISKAFGARPLFNGVTFSIESGEKISLIGPNGAGKSTLLRILAGQEQADDGKVAVQRGLRVGYVAQVPVFKDGATVREAVVEGLGDLSGDWEAQARVDEVLSKLSLSGGGVGSAPESSAGPDTLVDELSGGWQRRVALARELVKDPELLLLDEPTNHLDVESILWLEDLIKHSPWAVLTISHDRAFLEGISTRILELDRRNPQGLLSVHGSYSQYLETKASMMASQEAQEVRLRNTLRRETEWLRQGAKARTTKQQARIKRAGELGDTVDELAARNKIGTVGIDFQSQERNPKKLLEAKGISKTYGAQQVVPPLDLLITPKSRIGLLGRNGAGKSTLIRLLMGTEASDTGTLFRSDQLKPLYFEQARESLDPDKSVIRTVCPTGDFVIFRGQSVHVRSYLDRFLFSSGQGEMAVGKLSGGEQSRLLLARLMLHEANLLILDEPTNDLDLATLDVLQDVLTEFNGAIILVTHDRYFLDQVVTQILAFDDTDGGRKEIHRFAGLGQWEEWRSKRVLNQGKVANLRSSETRDPSPVGGPPKKRKLSFNEQRELDTMEDRILKAETRLKSLDAESNKPEVTTHAIRLTEITTEIGELQAEIDRLYERWAELGGG